MRSLLSVIILAICCTQVCGQSAQEKAEAEWTASVETANKEYFDKLEQLRTQHVEKLELLRKDATTNDRLDEAVKLRDLIESHKLQLGKLELPEEKTKLAKEKQRLANILRASKWNCAKHPHFPKWAGDNLIFHENGTMVPASNPNAKMPNLRWSVIDGRNIAALLGDFLVIFRLNEQENALDVYELASMVDLKTKRASVLSASLARSPRDAR